jgi:hypothetical protein
VFDPGDGGRFARALHDFWLLREQWPEMGLASKKIIGAYTVARMAETMHQACMTTLSDPPAAVGASHVVRR